MKRILSLLALSIVGAVLSAHAQAQDYPTKPVTFITPAAAGNSPDVVARVVADKLSQLWKHQVIMINRPGAGGQIAAQAAAAAEPDGYTLYMTQASTYTVLPIMQEGKMSVNLQTAFKAIGMVGEQPIAVAVNKELSVNNLAELLALVNKSKDGMFFGATNRGGQSHLTGELLRSRSKANLSFVHAAGASVSLNDLIAGRIPIMFEGLAGLAPGLQGNSIKLIAVASPKRLPTHPDLPTMSETVPGVVSSGWLILMAPAGVPDAIVEKINADLRKVVALPDVQERFHTLGTYSREMSPKETDEFIRSEEKLWWPIVREINKAQGVK